MLPQSKRTIAVFTSTRADYGLLSPVLRRISDDPRLRLVIVVTGTHLDPEYGNTEKEIEADGFSVDVRIPVSLSDNSAKGLTRSIAEITDKLADTLTDTGPDIVVALGDRWELLALASACTMHLIPIAHIHGGELTEGAMDNAIRHAVTKLSHIHFTSAESYRQRVIQMGEAPDTVFNVGALAIDNIVNESLPEREDWIRDIGFDAGRGRDFYLVTYHPVTLDEAEPGEAVDELLLAFDRQPDMAVLFTGVNADRGRDQIDRRITSWVEQNSSRAHMSASLGRHRYLAAMRDCFAVVGNSSSGIVEAPAMGVPTVNIGCRQDGRLRAPSIIDCAEAVDDIERALKKTSDPGFRTMSAIREGLPYGDGNAAKQIVETLGSISLNGILKKRFHDSF